MSKPKTIADLADGPRPRRRVTQTCPACEGTGRAWPYGPNKPSTECPRCHGRRRVTR